MPDLDQIKEGEQGVRDRGGRFARGRSGNPAGRPRDGQPPDFDKASFAELFAWSLAQPGGGITLPVKGPSAIPPSDGMTALLCCAAFVLSTPEVGRGTLELSCSWLK
jgi:hypothetical protein